MPKTTVTFELAALAEDKRGVVTRGESLRAGLSPGAIEARLKGGDWQVIHPGVYATFSGAVDHPALRCAAVLWAGPGAVLSHITAAELWGLTDRPAPLIHVTVPNERSRKQAPGVVVHRSRRLPGIAHPTAIPPRTRVEETILDLTQDAADLETAMGWLTRGVGSRRTTPDKLFAAMEARSALLWRRELAESLGFVAQGCESMLELAYFDDVERAHGLPRGERQFKWGRVYLDVLYRRYLTAVELDGRAYHPFDQRFRDMKRDNAVVRARGAALRYGPAAIFTNPCAVAAEVGGVMVDRGWEEGPTPCARPGCAVASMITRVSARL